MTSSTQQSNSNSQYQNQNFWAPQGSFITGVMNSAQNAFNTATANNANNTPSNFVAGLTPQQLATFNTEAGYNSSLPSNLTSAATGALNTGTGALSAASGGYAGFNPASTNNMNANVAGGNAYVAGANIPAQVQAAMLQGEQTAQDVTIPGMEAQDGTNGNINSTRTGVGGLSTGLVERGLAQNAQDLTGSLEGQAFGTGAALANATNTSNNNATLTALNGEGSLGLGALSQGANTGNSAINDQSNIFNTNTAGGGGIQTGNQDTLANQLQGWEFGNQAPFGPLSQYAPYVTTPYGSSGNSSTQTTTTTTPSFMSTLGSVLGAATSLGSLAFGGSTFGSGGGGLMGLMNGAGGGSSGIGYVPAGATNYGIGPAMYGTNYNYY